MSSADPLRATQLAAVVTTLAERPGLTAYVLGMHVPVPQPGPAEQARTSLLATSAPLPLVLELLHELQSAGRLQKMPGRSGDRWYLTVTVACSDCGATLTVASSGGKRYCRVNAGCHLAAGDPAGYDQDPADGEPPRAETDCRGSGIHDCPCEADGPDGLCACCRRGDQNGSCRYARMTAKRRAEHHPCALEEAGWNEPTIHEAVKAGLLAAGPAIKRDVSRAIAEEVLTLAAEDRRRTRNVGPYRDMRTSLRKLARGDPLPDPRDLRGGSDG